MKIDVTFLNYASFLSFRTNTSVPRAQPFWIRAVILKGTKGGHVAVDKYQNYEDLKRDFNLPD